MSQVLAVVSGKGGTGKTSVCAAVAMALANAGQKVTLAFRQSALAHLLHRIVILHF